MDCLHCGTQLISKDKRTKFCNHSCAASHANKNRDYSWGQKTSRSLLAHHGNSGAVKLCKLCNKEFETTTNSEKAFCSTACSKSSAASIMNTLPKSPATKAKMSSTRKQRLASGAIKVTGGATKWHSYKDIRVQGSYELRVCHLLDSLVGVTIKSWSYGDTRFSYRATDGGIHTYIVDFRVVPIDGEPYFVEVKGFQKDNDLLKWQAVRNAGFTLEVWFKKDIEEKEQRPCSSSGRAMD